MDAFSSLSSFNFKAQDSLAELIFMPLTNWREISVSGDDKKSYLQGQLTCDVTSLDEGTSTLGAHCDAKGKVWSTFDLYHTKNGYGLFQHASGIDTALTELKKYAVFSKIDMSLSENILVGVVGNEADKFIEQHSNSKSDTRDFLNGTAVKIEENRWLLSILKSDLEGLKNLSSDTPWYNDTLWDFYDIKAARPRVTSQIQNEHIPQAYNLQAIDGISFQKGCYTGQEIVARAKYRGMNKRSMYIVSGQIDGHAETIELERSVGSNWRKAGSLICHHTQEDGTTTGLIILPNNLEPDTKLRATQNPELEWSTVPLPYTLDE